MIPRQTILPYLISAILLTVAAGLMHPALGQTSAQVPVEFEPRTYRMISIPLELRDRSFEGVLFDDFGPYNVNVWRLFHYNSVLGNYDEYPDTGVDFSRGTAVWIINQDGNSFDIDEPDDTNLENPVPVVVFAGWNQIGMPFPFPIACRALLDQVPDLVPGINAIEGPVSYDGSEFRYNVTTCSPWQGYFIFVDAVDKDQPLPLVIPPLRPGGIPSKSGPFESFDPARDYMIRFVAESPATGLKDSENYLGIRHDARDGKDGLDFREAPPVGDFVRLSIVEDGARYAGNFKSPTSEGHKWDVLLQSSRPNEDIVVSLEPSGVLPTGFEMFILDREFRTVVPVEDQSFRVRGSSASSERRLSVLIGSRQFAAANSDRISLEPVDFELLQNYPNPFSRTTAIRYRLGRSGRVSVTIVNVLGQTIRHLENGYRESGTHVAFWDGTSDSGSRAASGIYLYRLESTDYTRTRTMTLSR